MEIKTEILLAPFITTKIAVLCNLSLANFRLPEHSTLVDSSWHVMAHGDAREGKLRGNRRMEWVASTLHTTSEHGVSSITTADAYTTGASSRLSWRPRRFKRTRPFRPKTKSVFCVCPIPSQLASIPNNRSRYSSFSWCFVYKLFTKIHVFKICSRVVLLEGAGLTAFIFQIYIYFLIYIYIYI